MFYIIYWGYWKMFFCENLMLVIIMCLFMIMLGLKKGMLLGKYWVKRFI